MHVWFKSEKLYHMIHVIVDYKLDAQFDMMCAWDIAWASIVDKNVFVRSLVLV